MLNKTMRRTNNNTLFVLLTLVSPALALDFHPQQQNEAGKDIEPKKKRAGVRKQRALESFSLPSASMQACLEEKKELEQDREEFGTMCSCQELPGGTGHNLLCVYDCAYCNSDKSTCGIETYQSRFDADGNRTEMKLIFEYILGHSETLKLHESNCDENDVCRTCSAQINGKECNNCQIQTCADGSRNEKIDCNNVEAGAMVDLCSSSAESQGNIFQAFVELDFWRCYRLNDFKQETYNINS